MKPKIKRFHLVGELGVTPADRDGRAPVANFAVRLPGAAILDGWTVAELPAQRTTAVTPPGAWSRWLSKEVLEFVERVVIDRLNLESPEGVAIKIAANQLRAAGI